MSTSQKNPKQLVLFDGSQNDIFDGLVLAVYKSAYNTRSLASAKNKKKQEKKQEEMPNNGSNKGGAGDTPQQSPAKDKTTGKSPKTVKKDAHNAEIPPSPANKQSADAGYTKPPNPTRMGTPLPDRPTGQNTSAQTTPGRIPPLPQQHPLQKEGTPPPGAGSEGSVRDKELQENASLGAYGGDNVDSDEDSIKSADKEGDNLDLSVIQNKHQFKGFRSGIYRTQADGKFDQSFPFSTNKPLHGMKPLGNTDANDMSQAMSTHFQTLQTKLDTGFQNIHDNVYSKTNEKVQNELKDQGKWIEGLFKNHNDNVRNAFEARDREHAVEIQSIDNSIDTIEVEFAEVNKRITSIQEGNDINSAKIDSLGTKLDLLVTTVAEMKQTNDETIKTIIENNNKRSLHLEQLMRDALSSNNTPPKNEMLNTPPHKPQLSVQDQFKQQFEAAYLGNKNKVDLTGQPDMHTNLGMTSQPQTFHPLLGNTQATMQQNQGDHAQTEQISTLRNVEEESDFAAIKSLSAEVGKFDGTPACDFDHFMLIFEDELACITNAPRVKAKYLFRALGLWARTHVKMCDPQNKLRDDYDALKACLMQKYGRASKPIDILINELHTAQADEESVASYAAKMQCIFIKQQVLDEKTRLGYFLSGLNKDIRLETGCASFNTLNGCINEAMKAEHLVVEKRKLEKEKQDREKHREETLQNIVHVLTANASPQNMEQIAYMNNNNRGRPQTRFRDNTNNNNGGSSRNRYGDSTSNNNNNNSDSRNRGNIKYDRCMCNKPKIILIKSRARSNSRNRNYPERKLITLLKCELCGKLLGVLPENNNSGRSRSNSRSRDTNYGGNDAKQSNSDTEKGTNTDKYSRDDRGASPHPGNVYVVDDSLTVELDYEEDTE